MPPSLHRQPIRVDMFARGGECDPTLAGAPVPVRACGLAAVELAQCHLERYRLDLIPHPLENVFMSRTLSHRGSSLLQLAPHLAAN